MPLTRAYSLLQIKAIDQELRQLTGIATTPETDRVGDIIEPTGASFKLPLPLLWQHNTEQPIGHVTAAKVTDDGIEIKAQILQLDEPGILKDRLDVAWQSIQLGLVRGLSIGFKALESERIKDSAGYRFLKWMWLELSAVTIPANSEATITAIKSLAALGRSDIPGATGVAVKVYPSRVATMTHADQLNSYKSTRDEKFREQQALMTKAGESGVTLDASESQRYDGLDSDIADLDAHIKRMEKMIAHEKSAAVIVSGETPQAASQSRSGQPAVVQVRDRLAPGQRFARYAMCVGYAKGDPDRALRIAKEWYPDERSIHEVLQKAAVPAASTTNTFGPALQLTDWVGDYVEFLRSQTIVDRIPGLRRAPFNVRIVTQTGESTGYWVGEGLGKPVTKGAYGTTSLPFHKVACIAVLTQEEVRFTSPSAELKVRDDITRALVKRIDQDFIDPTNAGTANVKPASILNGVTPVTASGTDYDNFIVDLANMLDNISAAKIPLTSVVLLMSDTVAMRLSLMRTALGVRYFPDITVAGGRSEGYPVIVSEHLSSMGSPSTSIIVALAADEIYLADDGAVSIDSSTEASIEMSDTPTQSGITGTGAASVSLWQANLLGLRAEREITWAKRRTQAAQYISGAAYAPSAT